MKNTKRNSYSESKEQILLAALNLFSHKGYTQTTIRDIIAVSGVTAPSIYHYFTNKEGILEEILKINFLMIDNYFDSYTDDSLSTKIRLKNIVNTTYLFIMENRDFFRFWFSAYYGPSNGTPQLEFITSHAFEFHLKFTLLIKKALAEGVKTKEVGPKNHNAIAWTIRSMFQLAINEMIRQGSMKAINRELLAQYLDFVLEAFKKKPNLS